MEERLITDYDKLHHEAKQAAAAGLTLDETCRWPFDSHEGRRFKEVFIMHKAALQALAANDKPLTPV